MADPILDHPLKLDSQSKHQPKIAITVKQLKKEFPPDYRLVVDNEEIPAGVVALLGQSGSGKSTLLRILAQLDDSRHRLAVRFPHGSSDHTIEQQRSDFSFAFQSSNLISNLTVQDNVEMGCRLAGIDVEDGEAKRALMPFFSDLKDAEIDALLQKHPSDLSVGMRQRVGVARAYLKAQFGCQVLFADEPTANLDPLNAQICFMQLRKWQRQDPSSRLLLLATHDLSLAKKADRVLFIGQNESHFWEEAATSSAAKAKTDRGDSFALEEDSHEASPEPTAAVPQEHSNKAVDPRPSQATEAEDGDFRVVLNGETRKEWDMVVHLLEGNDSSLKSDDASEMPSLEARAAVERSRKPARKLFLKYFFSDVSRGRERTGTLLRFLVVLILFLVMSVCSVLLRGVPEFAESLLESDRFLRLVNVESTGHFTISAEKLNSLFHLVAEEDDLVLPKEPVEPAAHILSGISPKRELPLRLYRADGSLHDRWFDHVQMVYPEHPELESEDVLFSFWGIPELGRESGVIVTPELLTLLGYDADAVSEQVRKEPGSASLYTFESSWRVGIPIASVREFPDDEVDLLIPVLLAHRIQSLDSDLIEARFRTIAVGPFESEQNAEEGLRQVQPLVEEHFTSLTESNAQEARDKHSQFTFEIKTSLGDAGKYEIRLSTDNKIGFSEKQVESVSEILVDAFASQKVEGRKRILPGNPVAGEPKLSANRATLFVKDFQDVPRVIDFIEKNRSDLKLKVLNSNNREFIRTAQLSVQALTSGVWGFLLMFGIVSFFGLLTSFSSMLRRKVSEIAVLKAFGSGNAFVFMRFLGEAVLVCTVSAVLAVGISRFCVIPIINGLIRDFAESRSTLAAPQLAFGAMNTVDIAGILLFACVALAAVVLPYIRKSTSVLLSLSE